MKILYVTFLEPSELFGGGIGLLQSLRSLTSFAEVDYVGPKFIPALTDVYGISLSNTYFITPSKNWIKRIGIFICHGITTGFYGSWKHIATKLNTCMYDCVYLEFTRQDFVVKWAKQHRLPVAVRAHNIESDYFDEMFKMHKSVLGYVHKYLIKKSERYCVKNADRIIAITAADKRRLITLYNIDEQKCHLNPVCVKHFDSKKKEILPEPYILITGSLWFGPNAAGTEWFLDKVWRNAGVQIWGQYNLVIAGAKPNEHIMHLAKELPHVSVYASPDHIDAFYQQASLYVAPIFHGAGMKVKVAEALSCGLPVLATTHASVGYEMAKNDALHIADSEQEFLAYLSDFTAKTKEYFVETREKVFALFEKNFSMESSAERVKHIISDMVQK